MENVYIINELTQGMELARQLKAILSSDCSPESKHNLIQGIITSYNRALLIINSAQAELPALAALPVSVLSQPESPISIEGSPHSGDFNQGFDNFQDQKVVSKKRKAMLTWKNQIRISTDNGLEGNSDDGYSWRKYGQKDILGAKFPRSYYRCTYRYVHNCMARKQVQRTDEDPTVFEITYRGKHSCHNSTTTAATTAAAATHSVVPPRSPENHQPPPPKSGEMLSNFRENLRVSTSDLDAMVPSSFSFPSSSFGCVENFQQFHFTSEADNNFVQVANSGSNYFPEWNHEFHHHDDSISNLSGRISTTTSATNSPLAFANSHDFSPNFPFNNSGFFI